MEDMESKLNAILGNPEMMSQLMAMAKTLGNTSDGQQQAGSPPRDPPPPNPSQKNAAPPPSRPGPGFPGDAPLDMAAIRKIASFAQRTGIDANQKALLSALKPYLSKDRIDKLARAMQAARIATAASAMMGGSGQFLPSGR